MSSISILGDTSGSVLLQAPAVSGSTTITMPAATGTMMVSGNMPTFYAYAGSTTLLINGTFTKVTFDTEVFDTNNNFASSRFTPTVAGYYQLNSTVTIQATGSFYMLNSVFKNGSSFAEGCIASGNASAYNRGSVSTIVYANGTTDYFEIYSAMNCGSNTNTLNSQASTYFNGCLLRAA